MHHRFYEELNDMVGSMVSSRVRSVVVCLLSAFLPGPFLVNAPGAKPELAAASAVPIAITNVTVIDVVSGARRTGLTGCWCINLGGGNS
jgi:hypothetical protein